MSVRYRLRAANTGAHAPRRRRSGGITNDATIKIAPTENTALEAAEEEPTMALIPPLDAPPAKANMPR